MWTHALSKASSPPRRTGTASSPTTVSHPLKVSPQWLNVSLPLGGYLLPPYKQASLRFIKDFLRGDKELLKAAEVRHFNVPMYPELAVEVVLKQVKGDQELMMHLPVYQDQKGTPDRTFFYGVLGTLAPSWLQDLIKHANRERNKAEGVAEPESIVVREDIMKKLEAEPFFSSK